MLARLVSGAAPLRTLQGWAAAAHKARLVSAVASSSGEPASSAGAADSLDSAATATVVPAAAPAPASAEAASVVATLAPSEEAAPAAPAAADEASGAPAAAAKKPRTMRKKAGAAAAVDGVDAAAPAEPKPKRAPAKAAAKAPKPDPISAADLEYEDFLVLPQQSTSLLAAIKTEDPLGTLTRIDTLHAWLKPSGQSKVGDFTNYVLAAVYTQQLDVEYMYDLYRLDDVTQPGFLKSEMLRQAVLRARPSALTDFNLKKLQEALVAEVGVEAIRAQEAVAAGLINYQLHLFMHDFVSATKAGPATAPSYELKRCAVLLVPNMEVQRLLWYTRDGRDLLGLAVSAKGERVQVANSFDALIAGVKAGVKLDRERLLQDFAITPLVYDAMRAVLARMQDQPVPGDVVPPSHIVNNTARDELLKDDSIKPLLLAQEDHPNPLFGGKALGPNLTDAQLRLVRNLERLEAFRATPLKRKYAPDGTPLDEQGQPVKQ